MMCPWSFSKQICCSSRAFCYQT